MSDRAVHSRSAPPLRTPRAGTTPAPRRWTRPGQVACRERTPGRRGPPRPWWRRGQSSALCPRRHTPRGARPTLPRSFEPSFELRRQLTLTDPRQDDAEGKKEEAASNEAAGAVVEERQQAMVTARVGLVDDSVAEEDGVEDSRQRAAGDETGAEQRARADLGFLGRTGLALDVSADEPAGEDRRGGRDRQVR